MGGKPSRAKRAWRRWPAHGGFLDDRPMDLRSQRGIPIAKSRETVIVSSGPVTICPVGRWERDDGL
jgi:hypothetical protein